MLPLAESVTYNNSSQRLYEHKTTRVIFQLQFSKYAKFHENNNPLQNHGGMGPQSCQSLTMKCMPVRGANVSL